MGGGRGQLEKRKETHWNKKFKLEILHRALAGEKVIQTKQSKSEEKLDKFSLTCLIPHEVTTLRIKNDSYAEKKREISCHSAFRGRH